MKGLRTILVIMLSAYMILPGIAQADTTTAYSLDESEIADLKEVVRYDKTKSIWVPRQRQADKEPQQVNIQRPSMTGLGMLSPILYIIIAAVVIALLYLIFSNIKVNPDVVSGQGGLDIKQIDNIEDIDTKTGLDLALRAHNYREAVRMLYIKLLQRLEADGSISWTPDKTNRDYVKEMSKHPQRTHFRDLSLAFDRIWYGNEAIDRPFFDLLRADFNRFHIDDMITIDE